MTGSFDSAEVDDISGSAVNLEDGVATSYELTVD